MSLILGETEDKELGQIICQFFYPAFDFESEVNSFRGFLHRLNFPVFFYSFFDKFFHLQHTDFTENIYRILLKQTCQVSVL